MRGAHLRESGLIAHDADEIVLSFAGPFSWPGTPDAASVFEVDEARKVEKEFELTAEFRNTYPRSVNGIRIALSLPFGLRVVSSSGKKVDTMRSGGRSSMSWRIRGSTPIEAGAILVAITTLDAGWVRGVLPVHIEAPPLREKPSHTVRKR